MGLSDTTSFATRNLTISGDLADGAFTIEDGSVQMVSSQRDPELGITFFLEARDEARGIQTSLDVVGNLGVLCPGASVTFNVDGDRLVAVGVTGAPETVVAPLMGLEVRMNTSATVAGSDEQFAADSLVVSSSPGEDGFSRMQFEGTTVIDGQGRRIVGSFELARIVEETEVPDWDGNTWEGQPIAPWE